MDSLPVVRSHERMDYKRCQRKWYWRWRRGLVPKSKRFGALDLGTWMHNALAVWYQPGRKRASAPLAHLLVAEGEAAMHAAREAGTPDHEIEKADELLLLGEHVATAYQDYYGDDPGINILRTEIPLEFTFPDDSGNVIAVHKLKPDAVYRDEEGRLWILEHKTAATIRTGHLTLDDQARPYVAMGEQALIKSGIVRKGQRLHGIMYNFLRKGLPDERPMNADGKYLNKNGTISKKQPPPLFLRYPVTPSRRGRAVTLRRVQHETAVITSLTRALRRGVVREEHLMKTPHTSCEKFCPFYAMCTVEEEGGDWKQMERVMFIRRDPYVYEEETTDTPSGFEMG